MFDLLLMQNPSEPTSYGPSSHDLADALQRALQGPGKGFDSDPGLETRLRQAQKMEALGRVALGVAHEFNNLLGIITGYSDILLAEFAGHETAVKEVGEIRKAADRAAALTLQLLTFGRRKNVPPTPVDVNRVLAGMTQ